jgi:DNA-binding transcriptional ArsR family regulator
LSGVAPPHTSKIGSDSRARLRQRSKRLFGNADRLEVALAVAESSGLVHAQELADRLGISPPRVRAQLLAFVDAGVMQTLPRSGLLQNYERLDDPFWAFVGELIRTWGSSSPGLHLP